MSNVIRGPFVRHKGPGHLTDVDRLETLLHKLWRKGPVLLVTNEQLAEMAGVRTCRIDAAMKKLLRRGDVLTASRFGAIHVLHRKTYFVKPDDRPVVFGQIIRSTEQAEMLRQMEFMAQQPNWRPVA